ncbi:MAG TPA: glucose-6-phosphate isomerase [Capillibacterium sp.]
MANQGVVLDYQGALDFCRPEELTMLAGRVRQLHTAIAEKKGAGSDFLGWVDLPVSYDRQELAAIKEAAARIREKAEVLVVAGIGGSYLGARAALEMLTPYFYPQGRPPAGRPEIIFAGHHLSGAYLEQLLGYLKGKEFCINVISKSGTTTETAVAFRFLKQLAEEKYGKKEAAARIFATTDRRRGALRHLAEEEGYSTFVIPDDIGGRYSVLTPVGLLPIAAGGLDPDRILAGAAAAYEACSVPELDRNHAYQYAALRQIFYNKGKSLEILVNYEPALHYFAEWWKQLFGESEGKDGKGLYPVSVDFTTDLHSLGQYIQEGRRLFFETILEVEEDRSTLTLPAVEGDPDGLNYLAGRPIDELNRQAQRGTLLAHQDGGVPCLVVKVPALTDYYFGYLVYFFEKACTMSGYLLGVNPFNQPGVEAYKKNMFALLGKAGFEEERRQLLARLEQKKPS